MWGESVATYGKQKSDRGGDPADPRRGQGGDGGREGLMKGTFGMGRENGSGMEMGRDGPVGVNGGRKAQGRKVRRTQAIKTGAQCSGSFLQGKRDEKAAMTDSSSFFCCFLFCF